MSLAAPHYLLVAETTVPADSGASAGRWRFVLRQPATDAALEADDEEPAASPERLELLAIIRGLEALDQPSRVTLVSPSRNVQAGLRFGLAQWRASDWQWERYGQLTAVKNADLWQRLDRLLEIHAVECRPSRGQAADDLAAPAPRAQWRGLRGGQRVRIDAAPHEKFQEPKNQRTKGRRERPRRFDLGSRVLRFLGF
jgi:ribonuclease HI